MQFSPSWNPLAPERPRGEEYGYRTHIDDPLASYRVFDPLNQIAQVKLYNWCRSLDFVNGVPIADLHSFLFWNYGKVTKRQLGRTLVQTTTYSPSVLKGKTYDNPKARVCYVWRSREDLQYGLEWMLSLWIWGMEYTWSDMSQLPLHERREKVLEIFDELGALEEDDLDSLYCDPLLGGEMMETEWFNKEPEWERIWAKNKLIREGEQRPGPKGKRPLLRSVV